MKRVLILFALIFSTQSVKLPPTFKKCNRKQPDLKTCVFEAARDAVPLLVKPYKEVNLPGLDPLEIPEITIRSGGEVVKVDQLYKNCKLYGFDDVRIDKFEFDFEQKTLQFRGAFPKITIKADFKADGKILALPLAREGTTTIILHDLKANAVLRYEEIKKGGLTYFKFVSSEVDIDPSLINFDFQNLFGDQGQINGNFNDVLNENWKEVFADVKADYTELINQILLGLLEQFFSKVSVEEAFD